jgi:SsrA-binding protein
MTGKNKNKSKKTDENGRTVAQNRKARHDYFIEETMEAGIVLFGTEVKSLRSGQASINESYAGANKTRGGEIFLFNAYIPEYAQAHGKLQHEVRRPRKLLLHKNQMQKLLEAVQRKGTTLVPLSIYFNARGIAKVELGIAGGKKQHDKRNTIKERDWKREKARVMRGKN